MSDRLRFGIMFFLVFSLVLFPALSVKAKSVARNTRVLSTDSEGYEFSRPSMLFFDPIHREVYITDEGKGQLVVYGADYFPKLSLGAGRGLSPVYGIFIRDGRVYASVGESVRDEPHILVMNKAFLPIKKLYFAGFEKADDFIPRDLVVAEDGTIYVVSVHASYVVVLDNEGEYLRTIIPRAEMLGVLEKAPIISLDIGSDGKLYFLSEVLGKIFIYSSKEKLLHSFGEKGGVAGKLSRPRGLALDEKNDQIYITDWLRHAVSAFDFKGEFQFEFGGKGVGRGWFQYPTDVCLDDQGNILVADTFNNRVQVFSITEVNSEISVGEEPVAHVLKRKPSIPEAKSIEADKPDAASEKGAEEKELSEKGTGDRWVEGAEGEEPADF